MRHAPRVLLLQVAAVLALLQFTVKYHLVGALVQQMTCSAPPKTLTYSCDNTCADAFTPCWLNSTASTASCVYECYTKIYDVASRFIILIPYGTWKSPQELAYSATLAPSVTAAANSATNMIIGDTKNYSYTSNDLLEKIDTLKLRSTTTAVYLTGGSYFSNYFWKGQVANVALAPDLLTKQTQVTLVLLRNLNMQPFASTVAGMFPAYITQIAVNNGLLTEFPPGFSELVFLKKLYLNYNFISTVDDSMGFPTITDLELVNNQLISFGAYFRNLKWLALSVNLLTEIPPVVPKHTLLEQLWLNNNSISVVTKEHELPNLTLLHLLANRVWRFEAYFPNLDLLDLSYNELTEIPPVIYNHTKLTILKLAGNNLKNVTLTNAQASFFANLKNFTFDESSISKDCFVYQQRDVHGFKFCIEGVSLSNSDGDTGGAGDSSSSSSLPVILAIVSGVIVLVVMIGLFVYCTRKNNRKNAKNNSTTNNTVTEETMPMNNNAVSAISLWSDSELLSVKVNAEEIQDIKRIGKGAYAEVWLVKYRKNQLLASKRLLKKKGEGNNRIGGNSNGTQEFIAEIKIVAGLEHPKIVQFIGVAWTIEADLQALFEYMDGGDLHTYLENTRTPRSWTLEKVQIAIDVVEALVYVHSFVPPLIHRDLKSRNVLLSKNMEAKLTDFGVSRFRSENNTMTAGVGTGRWLAPEVISGSNNYGPPADIFSFGAVLSELDTHALPYDDVIGPTGNKLADVALLQLISTGQLTPSFSASCPKKIVELAQQCFALNPVYRPTAAGLAYSLRLFKRDMEAGL